MDSEQKIAVFYYSIEEQTYLYQDAPLLLSYIPFETNLIRCMHLACVSISIKLGINYWKYDKRQSTTLTPKTTTHIS